MPQIIHYLDNLFFLSVLLKSLDSGLSTEADGEHFRGLVLGNLEFLASSLNHYMGLLEQNIVLIDRAEYVKLLERSMRAYARVLERLLDHVYPTAAAYETERSRLESLAAAQRAARPRLEALLAQTMDAEGVSDLVSEDELSELLRE